MKILSRDFTAKEKALLLVLLIVILGLLYYQFVHVPVTDALNRAASEKEALEVELDGVNVRVAQLERMKNEIDSLDGPLKAMPSYNNGRNVVKLLNNVLGSMGYNINLSKITKNGDQVRRIITLQFEAPDFETVASTFAQLTGSEYRCLISDVKYATNYNTVTITGIRVNATVTFFETMVGGVADSGLPADTAKTES